MIKTKTKIYNNKQQKEKKTKNYEINRSFQWNFIS